jgi:hypothetical protein
MTTKKRSIKKIATAMFTLCLSTHAHAIARKDVLICAVPDGSKFVLRSEYNWNPVPLPVYHHSRESKRTGWGFTYVDRNGRHSNLNGSANFYGTKTLELEHACANVGMKSGVPLAPFTFRREDGSWDPISSFPMAELNVEPSQGSEETRRRMEHNGIQWAAYNYGLILAQGRRLIYEKPLYRSKQGTEYTIPFAAVLQSISEDGGKTWSAPIDTENAQIFDIGKGWIEQSFRARPVSLNGKPVQ